MSRHARFAILAALLAAGSCAPSDRAPEDDEAGLKLGALARTIQGAYESYRNECECGKRYDNNCAHYLSNAFIKAGFSMPDGEKCGKGRLIRAKEMLTWFQSMKKDFHEGHPQKAGYYAVYQEEGGQGHVCIHREYSSGGRWGFDVKGTGDFSAWGVNWHYRW